MGMKPLRADSSLRDRLSHLLDELCVDLGFCSIPDDVRERIENARHLTADQFARDVLTGESFIFDPESEWFKYLRLCFMGKFGVEARAEDYGP